MGSKVVDPCHGCKKMDFPTQASEWTLPHLEDIGIYYSGNASSLGEIMNLLKKFGGINESLPEIILEIVQFMNTIWTFSFDVNTCEYGNEFRCVQDHLRQMKREFSTNEDTFRTRHNALLNDNANKRIFNDWCSMMRKFLSWWDVFLQIMREEETTQWSFKQLFLQFSMTCLLVPEIGKSYKSQMKIKGLDISGQPDVRFSRFSMYDSSSTVECVTLTEVIKDLGIVKNSNQNIEGESFSIHKELSSAVLGQHGIELLLETKRSFFRPKVSGMMCAGTKIIFTFLDMGIDHLKVLKGQLEGDCDKCYRSAIHYSRPYDFMDVTDRSEILEILFWFGYVQSSKCEMYRPELVSII